MILINMVKNYFPTDNITNMYLLPDEYIDEKDRYGFTALIYASKLGYDNIVQFLIDRKANLNIRDNNGLTALMHASIKGNSKNRK